MAVQPFRVKLDRSVRRTVLAGSVAANLAFTATTVAFILLWSRIDDLSPRARWLTRYVLVQGHLATENVIAAWYSSMLLLAVAGMSYSLMQSLGDKLKNVGGEQGNKLAAIDPNAPPTLVYAYAQGDRPVVDFERFVPFVLSVAPAESKDERPAH